MKNTIVRPICVPQADLEDEYSPPLDRAGESAGALNGLAGRSDN